MIELKDLAFAADWPAPPGVQAWVTRRAGGVSQGAYRALNLGDHVQDDPRAVAINRARLTQACQQHGLRGELPWLQQVHGVQVLNDHALEHSSDRCADASYTQRLGQGLVIMTADCLPVLFCDRQGQQVAAAHAGWRGLCDGVLEATVASFAEGSEILAYLGPAIGPASFEVDEPVKQAFLTAAPEHDQAATAAAFYALPQKPGHYLADLYALARIRLGRCGVTNVHGGGMDTYADPEQFFSYRRDQHTGRMASVIWLDAGAE